MIHVTAAVIPHGCADILRHTVQVAQQFFDRESLQIGVSFEGLIQIGNVGAVMLIVMNFHGHLVDVRLERIRWIGKRRKNVGHVTLLR